MTEAERERAEIVVWLRTLDEPTLGPIDHHAFTIVADAIERLAHKGTDHAG